jgi:hypothetical protein
MSTYTLISSQVLGSSAASVTFSSIPSTYKDLVLRYSFRDDYSGYTPFLLTVNGLSTSIYSGTYASGNGSAASSGAISDGSSAQLHWPQNTNSTANTFTNGEIYIPSYSNSLNKPFSAFTVSEWNTTINRIAIDAELIRITAAISSITLTSGGGSFVAGSSFYLYGI